LTLLLLFISCNYQHKLLYSAAEHNSNTTLSRCSTWDATMQQVTSILVKMCYGWLLAEKKRCGNFNITVSCHLMWA